MVEDKNGTFLDWVVVTCDRLLAGYKPAAELAVLENGNVVGINDRLESQPGQ